MVSRIGLYLLSPVSASTLFAAVMFTGCYGPGEQKPTVEEVVSHQSDSILPRSTTDWSGTVTITEYQCDWSELLNHPTATCTVPDTDVLVGGGAQIAPLGNPGALLTASAPDSSSPLTTWYVASKDHIHPYPHLLKAYAIGLRLAGVSGASLRNQVVLTYGQNSTAQAHPTATASPNNGSDYIQVGGGARVTYTGAGQLLTASYGYTDSEGDHWYAASKDHELSDPGWVQAVSISIPRKPVGYVGGCLDYITQPVRTASGNTGYIFTAFSPPETSEYVVTSLGGSTDYGDGPGRMLTVLFPLWSYKGDASPSQYIIGGSLASKDFDYANPGTDTIYATYLRQCKP